jgi:hypothetical protein
MKLLCGLLGGAVLVASWLAPAPGDSACERLLGIGGDRGNSYQAKLEASAAYLLTRTLVAEVEYQPCRAFSSSLWSAANSGSPT